MLKKSITFIALLLVFVLIITGCGKKQEEEPMDEVSANLEREDEEDSNMRETVLYYQDDSGYLVPVMRKIPWEEGIAKAALAKLVDSPETQEDFLSMGLRPLLPANTEILGMSINDGLAKVDLSKEAMECMDAIAESNMVNGVVLTLTEFPTIDRVQFMFDGQIVNTLKFGTKVGEPIEPKDINPELSPDSDGDGARVTVFFHTTSPSQYDYLVPVTRFTSATESSLETAIEELLKGPKADSNLNMDIPVGTELLGVQIDDGIAYINFSKEFAALEDSPNEEAVLKSIYMTAKQYPEAYHVKIMVDGKEYKGSDWLATSVFANEY